MIFLDSVRSQTKINILLYSLEEIEGRTSIIYRVPQLSDRTENELALLVVPRRMSQDTYRTLSKIHNSSVGHLGVERTIAELRRSNNIWEGMRSDVIAFIRSCPLCQKMSRIKVPIHTSPFTTASYGLAHEKTKL